MNKWLFVLVALALVGETQSNTPKRNVTLLKDSQGFYVGADFKFNPKRPRDQFGNYTYPMSLGLYTSRTFVTTKCLNFSPYNCKFWNCDEFSQNNVETYPYFVATGTYARTGIYVDYIEWVLDSRCDALIAETCNTQLTEYGSGRSGIIGMGLKGGCYQNFATYYPIFSIYLQKDLNKGALMFYENETLTEKFDLMASWSTDLDWKGWISGDLYLGISHVTSITASIIFDVNADAIGLGSDYYNKLLTSLKFQRVQCSSSIDKPNCTYQGYISSLPSIYIKNGTNKIKIPPEVYVKNDKNQSYVSSIILNIRALGSGSDFTSSNYVTQNYSNAIILDSNFMAYYYTVFDGTNRTSPEIYLYATELEPPLNNLRLYITIGVLGLILVFIICCSCCNTPKKIEKKKNSELLLDQQHNEQNNHYSKKPYDDIHSQNPTLL